MKKVFTVVCVALAVVSNQLHASEVCDSGKGKRTAFGTYVETDCAIEGHRTRSYVSLDRIKILEDEDLFYQDRSDNKSIWIYKSGKLDSVTGCKTNLYLVDLGLQPPKVIAFGVRKACNEFEWASWGEKRSVIALKHNVKFVYENGKLIPPEKGEKLWKAIEPPHAGPGLAEEDAIPFVEEVPPPK